MSTAAYEWETLHELEALHEGEGEWECEGEASCAASPVLREAAMAAARAALGSLGEGEWEWEGEGELNPVRKVYPDAALEHLAHAAMNAESEAEAGEAFLPLIPMVASRLLPVAARVLPRVLPRVMSAVTRVAPQLTRGVTRIAGRLFRNPRTRGLLRALPSIARRTVGTLARQAARGAPLTPRLAVRTLARQAAGVLSHPSRVAGTVRRSRALDRAFHRTVAPALGLAAAPVGEPGPGAVGCARCAGRLVGPPVMAAAGPAPLVVAAPPMVPRAVGGHQCQCACPCCGR
jgi:hypothetical protein